MGHKYVVFGAGRMGRAVAWFLANDPMTEVVKLVDIKRTATKALGQQFVDAGLGHKIEVCDSDGQCNIRNIVAGSHVCIATCGYQQYVNITKACIEEKVNMLDLGGNREVVDQQKKHNDGALKSNVTIIPDCGLAPGMIGILGMHVFEQIQHRKCSDIDVTMRVGGLPTVPGSETENPLQYELTWSSDGLINEYVIPSDELRDGKLVKVEALTDCENCIIRTPWQFVTSEYEAFITGGGSSNLPFLLKGQARNVNYKTLRYRGHNKIMRGLARLGFLTDYRATFQQALDKNLTSKTGDDIVIARAGSRGILQGGGNRMTSTLCEVFCSMREVYGQKFSAMAQTTGFSAGVIAQLIADNVIKTKGVVDGELAVPGKPFIERLQKTGIIIKEMHH